MAFPPPFESVHPRLGDLAARARTSIGSRPWLIGVSGSLVALIVLAGVVAAILGDRLSRIEHARDHADNLATIIANNVGTYTGIYDALLQDMVTEAEDPTPPLFPERVQHKIFFGRTLLDREEDEEAYIIGADGTIAASTAKWDEAVRLADRDYFTVHQRGRNVGLYVSASYHSRVKAGQISVGLSRRIEHPDHSFAGVALLDVPIGVFQRSLPKADPQVTGSVYLVRKGGDLLACQPCPSLEPGRSRAPNAVRVSIERTSPAPLDILSPRIFAVRRVADTPLFVVVVPPLDAVLTGWGWNALAVGSLALLFSASIAGASWMLASAFRARLRAQEELLALSLTDGLTGLSNRRAFDARLLDEWQHAGRTGSELSLLFIDIDHFKHFNDRHGHAVGDEVLRAVAKCIGAHIRRRTDMAARYGGEEFAVILSATSVASAIAVAEKIRSEVEKLNVVNGHCKCGSITVSIGCATALPDSGVDAQTILEAADAQLIICKANGRNQLRSIVLHSTYGTVPADDLDSAAHIGHPGAGSSITAV